MSRLHHKQNNELKKLFHPSSEQYQSIEEIQEQKRGRPAILDTIRNRYRPTQNEINQFRDAKRLMVKVQKALLPKEARSITKISSDLSTKSSTLSTI